MPKRRHLGITIIQVMRAMGVEPEKRLSWAVGIKVRNLWESITGELPPKDLRRKTNDPKGVHCFAIYPEAMRPHIERIVREFETEALREPELPF